MSAHFFFNFFFLGGDDPLLWQLLDLRVKQKRSSMRQNREKFSAQKIISPIKKFQSFRRSAVAESVERRKGPCLVQLYRTDVGSIPESDHLCSNAAA